VKTLLCIVLTLVANVAAAQCPNCPKVLAASGPQVLSSAPQVRVQQQQVQHSAMTHSQMVALHNRLHGGGSWTWPGDLAEHLRREHGVAAGSYSGSSGGAWQSSRTVSRAVTRPRWRLFGWRR